MAECRDCVARVFWAFTEEGRSMGFDQKPSPAGEWLMDSAGVMGRRSLVRSERRSQGFREHECGVKS